MAKSTAHATAVLAAIGDMTLHAETHVSLHTGDPGTTGASEASSAGASNYARVEINGNAVGVPDWNTAAAAAMTNNGAVTFPEGGDDQAITHFGIWDAATAGNFIRGGALDSGFTYGATVTPEFADEALEFTEA
jgi:hypothetical protein